MPLPNASSRAARPERDYFGEACLPADEFIGVSNMRGMKYLSIQAGRDVHGLGRQSVKENWPLRAHADAAVVFGHDEAWHLAPQSVQRVLIAVRTAAIRTLLSVRASSISNCL